MEWDDSNYISCIEARIHQVRDTLLKSDSDHNTPTRVAVIGSFILRTICPSRRNVDLVAYMPECFCSKEDLCKHRYLTCRSLYVSWLRDRLRCHLDQSNGSDKNGCHVQVCLAHAEKTCVEVVWIASNLPERNFAIRIHPAASQNIVRGPLNNLTIQNRLLSKHRDSFYWKIIAEDATMESQLAKAHAILKQHPILVTILTDIKETFAKFTVTPEITSTIITELLCSFTRNFNISERSKKEIVYQFLHSLDSAENVEHAIKHLTTSGNVGEEQKLLCRKPIANYNPAFRFGKNSFQLLLEIVRVIMKMLQPKETLNEVTDSFLSVTRKIDQFWMAHDLFLGIKLLKTPSPSVPMSEFVLGLGELLDVAFKDRIKWHSWKIFLSNEQMRSKNSQEPYWTVVFGLQLQDSPIIGSRVVKGPTIEERDEIESFKSFWGPNTDHRQFSDGVIRAARVFSSGSIEEIFLQIVQDVWERHRGIPPQLVYGFDVDREIILRSSPNDETMWTFQTEGKETSVPKRKTIEAQAKLNQLLLVSFNKLKGCIESVSDSGFPVSIEGVDATHASLRNCAVWAPRPHKYLIHVKESKDFNVDENLTQRGKPSIISVVVTLGKHSMWPDHAKACSCVLSSLHLELANILRKRYGMVCNVGDNHVNVVVVGFVFRVQLFYPRLIQLLRLEDGPTDAANMERDFLHLPQHHKEIKLLTTTHPTASLVIQFLKRLFSAQLLQPYISDETIELFVASQYFPSAEQFDLPNRCLPRSFLRGILSTLFSVASFRWDTCRYIINASEHKTSQRKLSNDRCVHIVTNYSEDSPFTLNLEPRIMLRCVRICRSALRSIFAYMNQLGYNQAHEILLSTKVFRRLFSAPTHQYDFLLRFRSTAECLSKISVPTSEQEALAEKQDEYDQPAGLYTKGEKNRAKKLHTLLSFDPICECLHSIHLSLREKIEIFMDEYAQQENLAFVSVLSDKSTELEHCEKHLDYVRSTIKHIAGDTLQEIRAMHIEECLQYQKRVPTYAVETKNMSEEYSYMGGKTRVKKRTSKISDIDKSEVSNPVASSTASKRERR